jgi:hypothetical protein
MNEENTTMKAICTDCHKQFTVPPYEKCDALQEELCQPCIDSMRTINQRNFEAMEKRVSSMRDHSDADYRDALSER